MSPVQHLATSPKLLKELRNVKLLRRRLLTKARATRSVPLKTRKSVFSSNWHEIRGRRRIAGLIHRRKGKIEGFLNLRKKCTQALTNFGTELLESNIVCKQVDVDQKDISANRSLGFAI